jgi:NAD(P)-dependent dehydrogenase (short-subunit alcohol dehydrogenase family)
VAPLAIDERMRLDGRNALVIGGSGEIGRTIAHTLAGLGADIGLAARNRDRCEAIVA